MSGEAQSAGGPGWERGPGLVGALWRHRWAVLVVACVAAAAGYLYADARPSVYEAVSRVGLANPYDRTLFRQERGVPYVDIERYLDTQADLVTSPDVLARAADLLQGRVRPGELGRLVTAESSTRIFEITVRARADDPVLAAQVANAVTQGYRDAAAARVQADVAASVAQLGKLEADLRRRLARLPTADAGPGVQAERDSLGDELATLRTRAGQIRADAAVYGAGIDRVEQAFPPPQPVSNSPRRSAAVFGLLGFIAALVWAFWRSERVRVVDDSDDAAGAVHAPLLGALPGHPADTAPAAALVVTAPGSSAATDHQFIAASLDLLTRETQPRVLLVTSAEQTTGTSVTALNLALTAAQNQRAVILADADPAGRLTGLLGADRKPGMSDLIARSTGDAEVALNDYVAPIDDLPPIDGFRFVPAGTAAGDGRGAATPQMGKLLAQLLQETDLVVLHGPPLLHAPTAMKIAADVDGVVLIVSRGTPLDDLRQTRDLLHTANAPVLGYVFDSSHRPRRWPLRHHSLPPAKPQHRGAP